MRVLYIDYVSQKGHIKFNSKLISLFSRVSDVDVMVRKGYEISFPINSKRYYLDDSFYFENTSAPLYKIRYRVFLKKLHAYICSFINQSDYEFVFFSYIEPISFSLFAKNIQKPCAFLDHLVGQIYDSRIKRLFWKTINPRYKAVFLEEYILLHMRDIEKIRNNCYLLPHPIAELGSNLSVCYGDFIFAPAASNSDSFIQMLIENHVFLDKNLKYKLFVKGKRSFNSPRLCVYENYLTKAEYDEKIRNCFGVLIPYADNYNYRTSGVFFEAIQCNKVSFVLGNNTLKNLSDYYGKTIERFDNLTEMVAIMNNYTYNGVNSDFESTRFIHSDESIIRCLKDLMYE